MAHNVPLLLNFKSFEKSFWEERSSALFNVVGALKPSICRIDYDFLVWYYTARKWQMLK